MLNIKQHEPRHLTKRIMKELNEFKKWFDENPIEVITIALVVLMVFCIWLVNRN